MIIMIIIIQADEAENRAIIVISDKSEMAMWERQVDGGLAPPRLLPIDALVGWHR